MEDQFRSRDSAVMSHHITVQGTFRSFRASLDLQLLFEAIWQQENRNTKKYAADRCWSSIHQIHRACRPLSPRIHDHIEEPGCPPSESFRNCTRGEAWLQLRFSGNNRAAGIEGRRPRLPGQSWHKTIQNRELLVAWFLFFVHFGFSYQIEWNEIKLLTWTA